jgi:hypothetical protein
MSKQGFKKQNIRVKYETKRKSLRWIKRKNFNKKQRFLKLIKHVERKKRGVVNFEAPSDFSFINNTEEVVKYFNQIKEYVDDNQPVNIDISKITNLSPDIRLPAKVKLII